MSKALAPWHLWGSDQPFQLAVTAGSIPGRDGKQVAQIKYGRPESWRFVLSLIAFEATTVDLGDAQLDCFWDLQLGLGRTTVVIPSWAHFSVTLNKATNTGFNTPVWASQVIGPPLTIGSTVPNLCDHVVAQDIQIAARFQLSAGAPWLVNGQCSAIFSPEVHVRPEWHLHHFPGGEADGK